MSRRAAYNERVSKREGLDYFPTPPWATRAMIKYVLPDIAGATVLEPACGAGHMAEVLRSYVNEVIATDIEDYGYPHAGMNDFVKNGSGPAEWVITNPPFVLAEEFIARALEVAGVGVAMLLRTQILESQGRYKRLYSTNPPNIIAQYSERVDFNHGKVLRRSNLPGAFCWLVWRKDRPTNGTQLIWIPPCRKELELDTDYDGEG